MNRFAIVTDLKQKYIDDHVPLKSAYFPFTFTYQNEPIKCIHVYTIVGYHLSVHSLLIAITQTGVNTTRRYDLTSELDAVIFDRVYKS